MRCSRGLAFLLCFVPLGVVAGCGGPSTGPQSSGSGSAASGDNAALGGAAVTPPTKPASIDLRTLPQVEQAEFTIRTANRLEGVAKGKASAIFEHYRTALEKLGWKLSAPPTKGQVTDDSASALLDKGDDSIFLSVSPNGVPSDREMAGEKQFSVGNLGTCDSSKLPRLAGAEEGYTSKISTLYFTDMKVAATAASVRNLLQSDGWQEFNKPYAGKPVETNVVRDEFRKQGNSLRLLISPARADDEKATQTTKTSVQYVIGAIGHQLPAPADARDVEFDDALYILRCGIPRDLYPVVKYYRGAMADLGYETPPELPGGDGMSVSFVCGARDDDSVIVDLVCDGLNTRVELRGVARKEGQKEKAGKQP